MLRIVLLPLLLFTISMACMGQTFQYSRGWTNGKRSSNINSLLSQHQEQKRVFPIEDSNYIPDLYDDRMLERYLMQLPRFMRNSILARTALYAGDLSSRPTVASANSNSNGDNNNNNNLYGSHHQSNELFDELSGALEPNDYGKH